MKLQSRPKPKELRAGQLYSSLVRPHVLWLIVRSNNSKMNDLSYVVLNGSDTGFGPIVWHDETHLFLEDENIVYLGDFPNVMDKVEGITET